MRSVWHHIGKQVLQDNRHFADAVGELEAMMIVNAMRALDEPPRRPMLNLNTCHKRREGDEFACICGLRWGVEDVDPPRCVHPTEHPVVALKRWLTAMGLAHEIDPKAEQALRSMCDEPVHTS